MLEKYTLRFWGVDEDEGQLGEV